MARKTTAIFDNKGQFSYGIEELTTEKIPAEVKSFIDKTYPGHKVLQAVAIRDNSKTVYQTSIQLGDHHIKIKSIGEDMEVQTLKN